MVLIIAGVRVCFVEVLDLRRAEVRSSSGLGEGVYILKKSVCTSRLVNMVFSRCDMYLSSVGVAFLCPQLLVGSTEYI